jgi:pyruvate dehydrogenase E2 component (dihydrolipoamide acetyltransferase)
MDIRVPNLGEGADSGSVVGIFVKEGDKIAKDQTLIELENEKAVAPIPSTHAGVITKIHVKIGDKISVGQAIVSLAEEGTQSSVSASSAPPSVKHEPATVISDQKNTVSSGPLPAAATSPTLRKMARDLGIDLSRVRGTESGGRIGLIDLRNYVQSLQSMALQPKSDTGTPARVKTVESIDFSKWGPVHKKAISSLRQKIGQKMLDSWTTIPHVTQFDEADITTLMVLRKKYSPLYEKKGARLTLTSFVLKAVVTALKKYPVVNASLDEASKEIVYKDYYHLGVAVDTESGLIVPVLKDVDKKNLLEISKELESLAEKTRSRKVSLDELKGGTFTISNLGGIGGTFFTPIINKPELAILGVGKGVLKPTVINEKTKQSVEARLLLPLGLSYDHRVIDGADGARFIRALVEAIETFSEKDVKLS